MVNLFLFLCVTAALFYREFTLYKLAVQIDPSSETLQFFIGGLKLFNNVTTFSILSFLDHFFSQPLASPVPGLAFLPVFSLQGVGLGALSIFYSFSAFLTILFLGIWTFEVKREGIFLRSKAVKFSLVLFLTGLLAEVLFVRPNYRSMVVVSLLAVITLYYFRMLSYQEHKSTEGQQVRAFKSFSIGLLLLLLSNTLLSLLCFFVFIGLEMSRIKIEQKRKLSDLVISVFSFKRLPFLTLLFYGVLLVVLVGSLFRSLFPASNAQLIYWAFVALFLRSFFLYHRSFLDLISISWSYKQVLIYFLFPAALWFLYPEPNRFEVLAQREPGGENDGVDVAKIDDLRSSLLPILADDRRIKVFGMSSQDPRCRLLQIELLRAFPDWSRNPEPDICPSEAVKVDPKELEKSYQARTLRTLLVFHSPRVGVPFDIPIFLKSAKVKYEKVVLSLKSWGLAGAIFYLADEEG